jgi:acyl-CoA synthetase (AMP-forming)/AMP-acid ligase II
VIFRSSRPDPEIPDASLAQAVLCGNAPPERAAIVDAVSGRATTYGELQRDVLRLAAALGARGLRRGEAFAVMLPSSAAFAVALLGISAAGGVVVPLNPQLTPGEIGRLLAMTRATRLLTLASNADTARAAAAVAASASSPLRELFVVGDAPGTTRFEDLIAADAPPAQVGCDPQEDLALLLASSGTSGQPKCVMLTHRNVVAQLVQLDAIALAEENGRGTRVAAVVPFFHVQGLVSVLLTGLRRGRTLVTLPRFEIDAFLRMIGEHQVQVASVVPPIAKALLKHPDLGGYDLSSLARIGCGSAPLGREVEEACGRRLGCEIGQGYGMTEMTCAIAARTAELPARPGSVGHLLPGCEARLVDPDTGADVALGEAGEIWLRGPNRMRGYLGEPSPFEADGWLRTGDIGRFDGEGYLTIVDRIKDLIKVKGFQVAPAELEAVLVTHPAVADAAVVGVPDDAAGEVPKAFVTLKGPATADELLRYVERRVAAYKRVRQIEILDALPRTPSGKLLRRLLLEREASRGATRGKRRA